MAATGTLSPARYLEILESVIFEGHYPLSSSVKHQLSAIEIYGSRRDETGRYHKDSNGQPIQRNATPWEAQQFHRQIGDLQHELGPKSLTDHLKSLDLDATDFDLQRLYARTMYAKYPQWPKVYQIAVRTPDGQLCQYRVQLATTAKFAHGRDLDKLDLLETCGWRPHPPSYFVTSSVVTCLRPLDADVGPSLMIGLGYLRTNANRNTDFALVWFLDARKFGIVYDYTRPLFDDDMPTGSELEEETDQDADPHMRANALIGSFVGVDVKFSLGTLEGDYSLGDGKDPDGELQRQLDADITFYLEPFAYKGFRVEDACRHGNVIQAMSQDLLMEAAHGSSS